jgi:hypothetical protein
VFTEWKLAIKLISAHRRHLLFKTIKFGYDNAWTSIILIVTNSIDYRIIHVLSHYFFHILMKAVTFAFFLLSYFHIFLAEDLMRTTHQSSFFKPVLC